MIRRGALLAPIAAASVLAGCSVEYGAGSAATPDGECIEQAHSYILPTDGSIELGIGGFVVDSVDSEIKDVVKVRNNDGEVTFKLDRGTSIEGDGLVTERQDSDSAATIVTLRATDTEQSFTMSESDVVAHGTAVLAQEGSVDLTFNFDCPDK